jgi:apolipoprotein N-acyltransferase
MLLNVDRPEGDLPTTHTDPAVRRRVRTRTRGRRTRPGVGLARGILLFARLDGCGKLGRVFRGLQVPGRAVMALLGGLSLALAFPKPGWSAFAWVAPGLILMSAAGRPGWSALRLGYLAGVVHYLVSLRWLLFIPFPAGAVAGWLALSLYLAFFPAVWVWLCWRMAPRGAPRGPDVKTDAVRMPLPGMGGLPISARIYPLHATGTEAPGGDLLPGAGLVHASWFLRTLWLLACAACWVAMEMGVSQFLTGFPWNLLGATQYQVIPLIQVASVTGIFGVSFLVVWFALGIAMATLRLFHRRGGRWTAWTELALVVGWGLDRLQGMRRSDRRLKMALIQPSIPQTLIWDEREDENRFRELMELSRLALATRPDLMVWPEGAMPSLTETNYRAVTNLLNRQGVAMLFGADEVVARAPEGPEDAARYDAYNSAFFLEGDGRFVGSYRKQRRVIFGEYVPLSDWLPVLRRLTPIVGGFAAGKGPVTFSLARPACQFSVLICFEDVFPWAARAAARGDVDVLLNLTNNGWFGESSAQWQHAASAVFRAVENGLPLVRCTNNGLTCWIDPAGRLMQVLGLEEGNIYAPGFMTAEVALPAKDDTRVPTWYRQHGDVFGWVCVGVAALVLGGARSGRRSAPVDAASQPGH